ncbi:MAG: hypothetical protein U0326_39240 [Polyangiales bacterium]
MDNDASSDVATDSAPTGDSPDVASDATPPDDAAVDATPVDTPPPEDASDASPIDAADVTPADVTSVDVPADVTPVDVTPADVTPADVPADGTPACRSDRDCSSRSQVCDLTRSTCVDCLRDVDCTTAGQQCLGYRCVTPTRCVSSRTCPGQVCDPARGVCVDCVTTLDCPVGQVCFSNACGDAPPPCRSDRDCSSRSQVCNPTRMTCVDCNVDLDCPTGRYCADGSCVPQVCAPGSASCADETSRRVCSADGRMLSVVPCPAVTNGTSRCVDGACASTCAANFADCDMAAANGCEVDLRTSPANCGRCGNACPSAGATAGCAAGACTLTCSAGLGNCDGDAANGCETNTATSNTHCGRCGNPCGAGQSCAAGACVTTSCPTGRTLCGGVCVDLNADLASCGACGRACAAANGTAACAAGSCQVAACNAGFANCNGLPADGCETSTATSTSNCGACGRACAPANATAACRAGACAVATCNAGFGDCNGSATDGCEASLNTSTTNCGACGRACAAGQSCQAGACITNPCATGQTLCGATCRNLTNDAANCGGCGVVCPTGRSCVSGVCSAASLRFSLTWSVAGDLDLAIVTPCGTVINYATLTSCGGTHGGDSQTTGPETITWSTTAPMSGTYSVCVIPYRISSATSFTVQVLRDGAVSTTRTGSQSTSAPSGTVCSRTGSYRLFDFVY